MTVPSSGSDSKEANGYRFAGFSEPRYTLVPDVFFDEIMVNLSEAELKVLLYIFRRTFGFKKESDNISLRQMVEGIVTRDGRVLDHGAGIAKSSVWRGIKGLVEKNIIETVRNSSPGRGDEATTYRLVFADPVFQSETPPVSNSNTPRVSNSNTQDTEEQRTEEQGGFEASKAPPSTLTVDKHGDKTRRTPSSTDASPPSAESENTASTRYYRKRADLPPHVMVPLTRLMEDLSRDLSDQEHLTSNISRAANLYAEYASGVDAFFVTAYEARTFARKQVNARSRMALFFAALERNLKAEVPHVPT